MSKQKPKTKSNESSINDFVSKLKEKFGESIMYGNNIISRVETYKLGIPSIDNIIPIPRGRMIELYGPESAGKTTACIHFMIACQKQYFADKGRNGIVALVDAEHAFDSDWATRIGLNINNMIISQPDSGDEALEIVIELSRNGDVDMVVVDSVASLIPKEELEGEMSDSSMGAQARMMSKGLKILTPLVSKSKTTVIFINQIREKVGLVFGNKETTPGGRALKFYSSVRMEITKTSTLKESDVAIGITSRLKVVKSKISIPFRTATFNICNGSPTYPVCGIDSTASLFDTALEKKVVTRSGSHYKYGDVILGNGQLNALKNLREDQQLYDEIYNKIYDVANQQTVQTVEELDDPVLDDDNTDTDL